MSDSSPPGKSHPYRLVPIAELIPTESNPRTHSELQIEQLRASIRAFGFTNPVLIDEHSSVIAGHGRLRAAQLEGLSELPAIEVRGLTDAQRRALVIADNQLALNAAWDADLLRAEIEKLMDGDFDMTLIGFNDAELAAIIAGPTPIDVMGEWNGMPEFHNEPLAYRSLIMHFKDDASVQAFSALIGQEIGERTKWAWFPAKARERQADKAYVSDAP